MSHPSALITNVDPGKKRPRSPTTSEEDNARVPVGSEHKKSHDIAEDPTHDELPEPFAPAREVAEADSAASANIFTARSMEIVAVRTGGLADSFEPTFETEETDCAAPVNAPTALSSESVVFHAGGDIAHSWNELGQRIDPPTALHELKPDHFASRPCVGGPAVQDIWGRWVVRSGINHFMIATGPEDTPALSNVTTHIVKPRARLLWTC